MLARRCCRPAPPLLRRVRRLCATPKPTDAMPPPLPTEEMSVLKLYRDCMRLSYYIAAQVRACTLPPPGVHPRPACVHGAEREGRDNACDDPLLVQGEHGRD